MLIKEKKTFHTFRQAAKEIQQKKCSFTGSIMGIIIDMTRPLFRERDKDYIIELKLIDDTVNDSTMFGILIKSCSVYIFGKSLSQLQFCNSLGQIVLLQQFSFNIWNEIKFQTKYLATIEKLSCLEVQGEEVTIVNQLSSSIQDLTLDNIELKQRALKLNSWFKTYFYSQYRPMLGIDLINNYCIMAEPFNMILKYSKQKLIVEGVNQEDLLHFEDPHGNYFFINKQILNKNIPTTQFVFIRGIQCIANFYQIQLTETGNILGLPEGYDSLYEKDMNYCAVSRFNQKFLLKNHKACQLSKITYVSPKTTPVIDILNSIQVYENKQSMKDQIRVQDLYMIEAIAINFQGRLNLFHTEHQLIAHRGFLQELSNQQKKEMLDQNKLAYLYEGVIGVLDRSSQCTGRLLYVHLFSNQERTQFFDPKILQNLNNNLGKNVDHEQMEKQATIKIQQQLQQLITKSDFTNTISMLIQPIKSDVLIYRLTNTIFI